MPYTKITLVPRDPDAKPLRCSQPFEDAGHVVVDDTDCPGCGVTLWRVAGCGRRIASDDHAYEADAVSLCCDRPCGVLRVEIPTLFGLREDERVMAGAWRVY